eukprot:TRINITY_DN1865_c0_g1_i1.p1 TRINITY_DN1865_c0_g1~~TRINITY_DN1865_c0_g1_i1.p1  ORF type:complete len:150 (-),score=48.52 TRINITY_DN1865_c0_g1_i1:163-612(-)
MAPVSAPRCSSPAPVAAKLQQVSDENTAENVQRAADKKTEDVKAAPVKGTTEKQDNQKASSDRSWAAKASDRRLALAFALVLLCVVAAVSFYFSDSIAEVVKKLYDEAAAASRKAMTAVATTMTNSFRELFSRSSSAEVKPQTAVESEL